VQSEAMIAVVQTNDSENPFLELMLPCEDTSEDMNGVIHLKVHNHPYEDSLSIPYFIRSR
jgi:hypothetical protein